MGQVFSGAHEALGKKVAIKVMSATGGPHQLTRFRREANLLGGLRGDHVVHAFDFGVLATGEAYLVMEHLDGLDFKQRIGQVGKHDVATAVGYALQACEGLSEAHARGLVHRDIKPANLFLAKRPDGTDCVKVLDFGLAKVVNGDRRESVTETGVVVATVQYASPEQLVSSRDVSSATDQFSLALVLYELICGERAFPGMMSDAANAILSGRIPDIREREPSVPVELAAVLRRAMAKDPGQRFTDIAELARELAPFAPSHRIHAERATRMLQQASNVQDTKIPLGTAVNAPTAPTGATTAEAPPTATLEPIFVIAPSQRAAKLRHIDRASATLALLAVVGIGIGILAARWRPSAPDRSVGKPSTSMTAPVYRIDPTPLVPFSPTAPSHETNLAAGAAAPSPSSGSSTNRKHGPALPAHCQLIPSDEDTMRAYPECR